MGKKTITLLVGVLAAVLLGAPAQAFSFKKKLSAETSFKLKKPVTDKNQVLKLQKLMERVGYVPSASATGIMTVVKGTTEEKVVNFFGLKASKLFGNNISLKAPRSAEEDEVDTIVTPPADLETTKCTIVGYDMDYDDDDNEVASAYNTKGQIGINGTDVYVKGLFKYMPNAWMKGTIDGTTVTFPMLQYLGVYSSFYSDYDIWTIGINGEEYSDISMTYDAEAGTLTLTGDVMAITVIEEQIYLLQWLRGIVVTIVTNEEEAVAVTGAPIDAIPYYNGFDSKDESDAFGFIDSNDDEATWDWSSYYGCMENECASSASVSDDWLVSPAIYLEADKSYRFAIDTHCEDYTDYGWDVYPEDFEVKMGTEPKASAMTIQVVPETHVDWGEFQTVEADITVAESGYYHFGIHCVTPGIDGWYFSVDNFVVEAALDPTSPVAPTLSVTADPDGLEKAIVLVTAPGTSINGEALDNVAEVKVMRDGKVVATFEDLRPNAYRTFVDYVDGTGLVNYTAQAFDEFGKAGKRSEKLTVFVGEDEPAAPENVKTTAANNKIAFSWDPVTTGANGGNVNTKNISYSIYTVELVDYGDWGTFPVLREELAVTKETSAEVEYDTESGEQRQEYFAVVAGDMYGESTYAIVTLGKPYEMPVEEHFPNAFQNAWNYDYTDNVQIGALQLGTDEDGIALAVMGYADDWAWLSLDKVAITGKNPTLLVDVIGGEMSANTLVKAEVETPAGKTFIVGALVPNAEGSTLKASLKGYDTENYPYVRVKLSFLFSEQDIVLIDNVRIMDLCENNLTANLNVQESVKAGKSAPVVLTVQNVGEKAANAFKVLVKAEGYDTPIYEEEVTEALAPFEAVAFYSEFHTSIFDDAKNVKLTATVTYDGDEVPADNVAEAILTIEQSTASQPQNVKAERKADGIVMSWETTDGSPETVTETFANLKAGSYDDLGEWKGVNNNGATKDGIFEDVEFPFDGKAYGFAVMNPAALGLEGSTVIYGPSGTANESYLVSAYNYEASTKEYIDNDDWLISPELPGNAQTISFLAKAFNVKWGTTDFEVYYSTTNQDVKSFTLLEGSKTSLTDTNWNKVSFDLPAGAKYFAIRNITDGDAAVLFGVAQITFQRIGGSPTKFNIYVEGEDGVYDTTAEKTYTVQTTAPSWVAVSAVYANDEESKPVIVELGKANQEISAIEMITGNNKPVDIYSLDGKLVRQQTTSLNGLKGAFIINGSKVIVK